MANKRQKYLIVLKICCVFLMVAGKVFAQEQRVVVDSVQITSHSPTGFSGFFYGHTRPWLLKESLNLKDGQVFKNQKIFDQKIIDVKKSLNTMTLLQGNSNVQIFPAHNTAQDGAKHVIVTIDITESFNFIAYPRGRFSSSSGANIGIRFRHYNFAGFMQQWKSHISYERNSEGRSSVRLGFDAIVPFYWLNRPWYITFDNSALLAKYYGSVNNSLVEEKPFESTIGLSTNWKLKPIGDDFLSVSTSISQTVQVIARKSQVEKEKTEYDPYILASGYGLTLYVPIYKTKHFGRIYSQTGHSGSVSYRVEHQATDTRRGFSPSFSQGFYLGTHELIGNMRKGLYVEMASSFTLNPYRARHWGVFGEGAENGKDQHAWRDSHLWVVSRGYLPLCSYVATAARLGIDCYLFDSAYEHELAGPLRGIRDSRMRGDAIIYWNCDLMFKMWLGRFDVLGEVWLTLFYDGGMVYQRDHFTKPYHSAGGEMIYYPAFSRNVRLRVCLGEDIESMFYNGKIRGDCPRDGKPQHKIYIGMDLHY